MKNEEFTKKRVQKTKIIPTTQCEDDFYYYLYTLGLSIYHASDSMLPSPPLFLFLQTKGRKSIEKKEFFILTSHTHLGALKAHGYWDEDSDL